MKSIEQLLAELPENRTVKLSRKKDGWCCFISSLVSISNLHKTPNEALQTAIDKMNGRSQ